ncbi:hypothetical protein CEN46_25485, partial [Fischerella thermalis CCMEE 5318]
MGGGDAAQHLVAPVVEHGAVALLDGDVQNLVAGGAVDNRLADGRADAQQFEDARAPAVARVHALGAALAHKEAR